jgi:hypothetical protein
MLTDCFAWYNFAHTEPVRVDVIGSSFEFLRQAAVWEAKRVFIKHTGLITAPHNAPPELRAGLASWFLV